MATIRKREWRTAGGERREAWRLTYYDASGRRCTKQFEKKGEASDYLTRAAWEVSQGIHTADSDSITVSDACDLWLARARRNDLERSTIKQYDEWARLHIKPLIGTKKLSRLTMPDVVAFRNALIDTRSRAMAHKVVRGLSSILAAAQEAGKVSQNVAKDVRVDRAKRDKKRATIPLKEDLRALLETAADQFPDFLPLVMTDIFTGLRSSELRGLRKIDVDLKTGQLHVRQRADQWGVIGPPKSEAGTRSIPIPPMLITELRKWMLRAPHSELGLMFPNSEGGVRLHSNMLNREYWPLQVAAGLTKPTGRRDAEGKPVLRAKYEFHALRHAAASFWIKQKVDLKRLTTWLGHSSVQMTLDVYGHLLVDEQQDAAIAAAAAAELMA